MDFGFEDVWKWSWWIWPGAHATGVTTFEDDLNSRLHSLHLTSSSDGERQVLCVHIYILLLLLILIIILLLWWLLLLLIIIILLFFYYDYYYYIYTYICTYWYFFIFCIIYKYIYIYIVFKEGQYHHQVWRLLQGPFRGLVDAGMILMSPHISEIFGYLPVNIQKAIENGHL